MSGEQSDAESGASESGSDASPGQREVARRVFAAEYDDATLSHSESDEERAPNYVITPTGARINRMFVVGVLTAVERVNEEMLRARIADPTGAFVAYAGQYQPDALAFFERTDPPAFVALTGKARTFQPEDGDRVYTSVRPESINEVDADTRDRWIVRTAEMTLERLAVTAEARSTDARGDDLAAALRNAGVDPSTATGIALALDHYGTTEAYLEAVRRLAVEALEVVADERDEVAPLDVAPDERGETSLGPLGVDRPDVSVGRASPVGTDDRSGDVAPDATSDGDVTSDADVTSDVDVASDADATSDAAADRVAATSEIEETPDVGDPSDDELGAFDPEGTVDQTEADTERSDDVDETVEEDGAVDEDDLYELDESERQAVKEEYGVGFETGSEVDAPGEADIDVPDADEVDAAETGSETADIGDETVDETTDEPDVEPSDESDVEPSDEPDAESTDDVDLESAVLSTMDALDDGDGADRESVIDTVVDDHDADPEAVEDAIQDALMDGRCYEPTEDRLKPI